MQQFNNCEAANTDYCPMYICSDKPLTDGICASKEMGTDLIQRIYLTPCEDGYSCDLDKIKTQTQVKCEKEDAQMLLSQYIDYSIPDLYETNNYNNIMERRQLSALSLQQKVKGSRPGENCIQNSDCLSGQCLQDKQVCSGAQEGSSCDFEQFKHDQCDVGLFCNTQSKKCQKQNEIGETCDENIKCVNWGSCSFGKCVQRRSLNATEEIESSLYRDACYNFYAIEDPETKKTYCSPGPYLNNTHVCESAQDKCSYFRLGNDNGNSKTFTETTQCQCGYSNNGQAFCPFKEGDEQFTKTLPLAYYFWSQKPKCHIGDPSGCQEAKNTKGYYTIVGSRQELIFGHELMLNADCMKKMNKKHQRYWEEIRVKMAQEIQQDIQDKFGFAQVKIQIVVLLTTLSIITSF
eukprot:403341645